MFSFYSRIVVAFDGSDLGKKSLQMAKALGNQDDRIEIHVLHVVNPKNYAGEFGMYETFKENVQNKLTVVLEDAKEILQDSKNKQEFVVLKGNPAEMLIEYAKNRDVDLIVMGSRGLGTFKQMVMGSVSHNVVQHAHCPVLIAK